MHTPADKQDGGAVRRLIARHPLPVLAVLVAAQTGFTLDSRPLFYSDEVRHADVLESTISDGHWLRLTLNDEPYPDKPPLYFWMLAGLGAVTGLQGERLIFAGTAISIFALAAATWTLGRVALGRREDALTATMLLLGCASVVALAHYARMDQMFAALITAAHACLLAGLKRDRFSGWVVAGFAAVAMAALVKGPFAVGFAAVAVIGYLLWSGRPRRLIGTDVLVGAAVLGVVIGGWLAAAWLWAGSGYVENIVFRQTFERTLDSFRHAEPWWFYLPVMPLLLLPWTAVALVLPWRRLTGWLRPGSTGSKSPTAYLRAGLLLGFLMLSAISIKTPVYPLPLLPVAMVLTAGLLSELPGGKRTLFWRAAAVLLFLQAAGAAAMDRLVPLPVDIGGGLLLAGALVAGAAGLWVLAKRRPVVPAAWTAGVAVLAGNVLAGVVAPSVAPALSPRDQAEHIARYADAGYAPLTYETYPGIYTFYAGRQMPETWRMFRDLPRRRSNLERFALEFLSDNDKAVIAMTERRWREHWRPIRRRVAGGDGKPAGKLTVAHRQWLEDQWYLLVVWKAGTGEHGNMER